MARNRTESGRKRPKVADSVTVSQVGGSTGYKKTPLRVIPSEVHRGGIASPVAVDPPRHLRMLISSPRAVVHPHGLSTPSYDVKRSFRNRMINKTVSPNQREAHRTSAFLTSALASLGYAYPFPCDGSVPPEGFEPSTFGSLCRRRSAN